MAKKDDDELAVPLEPRSVIAIDGKQLTSYRAAVLPFFASISPTLFFHTIPLLASQQ